jgi:hypothetical protein
MKAKLLILSLSSLLLSGCIVVDRQIHSPGVYVYQTHSPHRFRDVTPVRVERKIFTGPDTYRYDSYIGYRDAHGNVHLWPGN